MRSAPALLVALLVTSCGAGAPTYADCVDELDCADRADTCFRLLFDRSDATVGDGNLCTRECAADADCPGDGVCIALAGDPTATFFCASPCAASADCYAGFACTSVGSMDTALCLP